MSNLSAFMQPNVEQVKNHKYVASHRIKGEDGKPVEWEICCISADEYARIRGACHDAVCSVRHHFAGALPGFSCQLRSAEKDNAFFPAEESIRLHPVRKMRRHRQQPRSTQLDLL